MRDIRKKYIEISLYLTCIVNIVIMTGYFLFLYFLIPFGELPPFISKYGHEFAENLRGLFTYLWLGTTPILSFIGIRYRRFAPSRLMPLVHFAAVLFWGSMILLSIYAIIVGWLRS
jgi:hypothetical protein